MTWNRENRLCIQLDHAPIVIFSIHREKIQKLPNVLLPFIEISFFTRYLRNQIVCKLFKDGEGSRRIKIKYVCVFLSIGVSLCIMEQTRILRTECSLHIKSRTRHVGKHQNSRPLGNGHSCRKLSDRERNCLIISVNRFGDTIKRLLILIRFIQLAISRRQNDFVVLKDWMQLQLPCKCFRTGDTVQNPKCMFKLIPQFCG